MVKIKLIILMTVLIIVSTLVGCSKDKAPNEDTGEFSEVVAVDPTENTVETPDNESQGVLKPKDIVYDLVSAVDSVRPIEDIEKYPAEPLLVPMIVEDETVDNNTVEVVNDIVDDRNSTTDAADGRSKEVEILYVNPERVKKFFEDTGTSAEDYKDLYIAHYPEHNYTVGVVIPAENKEGVLRSIKDYKDNLYKNASEDNKARYEEAVVEHVRGCIVIVISEYSDVYSAEIRDYIKSIYELLNNAVIGELKDSEPVETEETEGTVENGETEPIEGNGETGSTGEVANVNEPVSNEEQVEETAGN